MKKVLTIFATILILPAFHSVYSQQIDATSKESFQDAEYFFNQESYPDALLEYVKLARKFPDNANFNYKIGICYLNMAGQKDKAVGFLQKAASKVSASYKEGVITEKNAPIDAFLYLGNAFRINNQLDNAMLAYRKYKDLLGKGNTEDIKYAEQQIAACKTAQEYMSKPYSVKEINLGRVINNSEPNIRPVISGDGKTMAYVTKKKFYDAVYVSRFRKNMWSVPTEITEQIISDGNQYPAGLSYTGDTLFLNKEDNFNSDLYVSRFVKGVWTPSKSIGKTINTRYWESYASLTSDGKELFFASNRKGGQGNMDIYFSRKTAKGDWGTPVNLGKVINTELNEDCPFITPDGKILFFSSQGHQNMGGFDIFYSKRLAENEWSEPVNLGYPINTTDDDLYFAPEENGHYFYLSRFEKGGMGQNDIYRFELLPDDRNKLALLYEIQELKVPEDSLQNASADSAAVAKIIMPLTVKKEVKTKPTKPQPLTKQNVPATDTTRLVKVKKTVETHPPVTTGKTAINKAISDTTTGKTVLHAPKFELSGVFFAFNSYALTDEAKKQLDILVNALKAYPDIEIEINGYADSRGTGYANMAISKLRAESVARYLSSRGIMDNRMKPVANGSANPIALNSKTDGSDNPEGRRLNRRVEFRITSGDSTHLLIKAIVVPDSLKAR